MRKILLVAACATILGGPAVTAQQPMPQLSPKDPKYNSPECRAARSKTYDGPSQAAAIALSALSGIAGSLAERKRVMFERQIELACMSNPPKRPMLEPGFTATKD